MINMREYVQQEVESTVAWSVENFIKEAKKLNPLANPAMLQAAIDNVRHAQFSIEDSFEEYVCDLQEIQEAAMSGDKIFIRLGIGELWESQYENGKEYAKTLSDDLQSSGLRPLDL